MWPASLPPSVRALLLQIAACAITASALLLLRSQAVYPGLLPAALLCGLIAAGLSHLAGLARWWVWIQLAFAPVLVLASGLNVPPGIFLAAFVILLAVYWSTFRTQVPLYLSSNKVWHALEALLPAENSAAGFTFVDLGSGLGGVLTHLAQARPDGRYYGVESAPLPLVWSWLRIKLGRHPQCEVRWGSLWDCQLRDYDVVFAYLSPVPMQQLWEKARAEMRPGSLFVSSTFAVPDEAPHEIIKIDDLHQSTLLVWRM
jgi:hypothetical protein